jgi:ABC-2 type transport system ATP-binding protein
MTNILEVGGLSKDYPLFSLQELSFSIPGGSIMGFIGPNGAGKTTTMKALLGMIQKKAGSIRLFGEEFDGSQPHLKERVGVVMDTPFYVEDWTLLGVEQALAPFYTHWDSAQYRDCLSRFSLDPRKKVKELSRGMEIKLMLAVALSHDARLLLLDEPTSGLDPVARDELMDILREFVCDEEHAILFSTHITSDLEKIADYITFLQKGRLVFSGEKDALLEGYCMVRGGASDLTSTLREKLLGLREHSVGFEGMLSCRELRHLPQGVMTEPCTLDEIMVHMNKEGRSL